MLGSDLPEDRKMVGPFVVVRPEPRRLVQAVVAAVVEAEVGTGAGAGAEEVPIRV